MGNCFNPKWFNTNHLGLENELSTEELKALLINSKIHNKKSRLNKSRCFFITANNYLRFKEIPINHSI